MCVSYTKNELVRFILAGGTGHLFQPKLIGIVFLLGFVAVSFHPFSLRSLGRTYIETKKVCVCKNINLYSLDKKGLLFLAQAH